MSYWAIFLICVLFAGVFQSIGVCLVPLLEGGADYATSWGTMAIVRPEVISVPVAIAFTALAFLYVCLCFYLFFAGLILLYTMVHDLKRTGLDAAVFEQTGSRGEVHRLCLRLMRGVFRCTVLGLLVALCTKAQSSYLTSNAKNILDWLAGDFSSVLAGRDAASNGFHIGCPPITVACLSPSRPSSSLSTVQSRSELSLGDFINLSGQWRRSLLCCLLHTC